MTYLLGLVRTYGSYNVIDKFENISVFLSIQLVRVSLKDTANGMENEGIFTWYVSVKYFIHSDVILDENGFFNA